MLRIPCLKDRSWSGYRRPHAPREEMPRAEREVYGLQSIIGPRLCLGLQCREAPLRTCGDPNVIPLSPRALVGKLNNSCRRALEAAAGLCLSRTNYNVEIEHWLLKILEMPETDLPRILKHYEADPSRVSRELTRSLDKLKTGNARAPELSLEILDLIREAWVLGSLEFSASRLRSGF